MLQLRFQENKKVIFISENKCSNKVTKVFFRDAPIKLFLTIANNKQNLSFSQLSRQNDIPEAHSSKLKKVFKQMGLIKTERIPTCMRTDKITLTEKGENLYKKLLEMIKDE